MEVRDVITLPRKSLLAMATALELFKYYVIGRHFTVVADNASLTRLCRFQEPESVVARWIVRPQLFDFKIGHRPSKHRSHTDGLAQTASKPSNHDGSPECPALLYESTTQKEAVSSVDLQKQYTQHFDGYIEMIEDDSNLFRDPAALASSSTEKVIPPELL